MSTITKLVPSSSTNGRPIKIAATATAGTQFHAAHATDKDEIHMLLTNTSATEAEVTVEFGGTTSPDDLLKFIVPAKETIIAIPGIPLTGGLVVRAFADVANVVNMSGWINRITT